MIARKTLVTVVVTLPIVTSCASTNSPMAINRLRMISAGHTGCLPEENDILNVKVNLDGTGTWNAMCKAKTYLCSAVPTLNSGTAYACAPVAH